MSNQSHNFKIRVYYEDTDAGGVVYHATYLNFCERARSEFLRELGFNQSDLEEKTGMFFVVRSAHVDYQAPAKLDDELDVITRIKKLGNASIEFVQKITRGDSLLIETNVTIVCVNEKMKPIRVPEEIRTALSNFLSD